MSNTITGQSHIAFELIDEISPEVVVIEFLGHEIAGPSQAAELGKQLSALIRPGMPHRFVIDFSNVQSLGSCAFGELVSFARRVLRVYVCNIRPHLRFGASLIGLDDCAEFAASRRAAISAAMRAAMRDEDATIDYPASWLESDEAAYHACEQR
jgi:anti-anti-sigma regulatory factor